MGLELLDGMFSGIAAMGIRQEKLELDVPFLLDDAPIVVSTVFVFKDL